MSTSDASPSATSTPSVPSRITHRGRGLDRRTAQEDGQPTEEDATAAPACPGDSVLHRQVRVVDPLGEWREHPQVRGELATAIGADFQAFLATGPEQAFVIGGPPPPP